MSGLDLLGAEILDRDYATLASSVAGVKAALDKWNPITYDAAAQVVQQMMGLGQTNLALIQKHQGESGFLFGPAMATVPQGHLAWHANQIAIDKKGNPTGYYQRGDDLKTWLLAAYKSCADVNTAILAQQQIAEEKWQTITDSLFQQSYTAALAAQTLLSATVTAAAKLVGAAGNVAQAVGDNAGYLVKALPWVLGVAAAGLGVYVWKTGSVPFAGHIPFVGRFLKGKPKVVAPAPVPAK